MNEATERSPGQRDGGGSRRWAGLIGLWLVACAWLLAGRAGAIGALRMPDSDDALRLLQMRDWLGGQGWFDLRQYRLDPPGGADIHWTRLVDLPLAATIVPLRPLVGAALAETIAAATVPLVTLLAAMAVLAGLARRLIAPVAWWWAPLLLLMASPVVDMMAPLRIDHHGWQIVLVLAMILGLTAADRRRGGLTAGLAIAASLTIGVEMLPYLALAAGLAALGWVADPREGVRLRWLCGVASVGVGVGLLAFVPPGQRFAGACDALSGAYALPLWAGGAVLLAGPCFVDRFVRACQAGIMPVSRHARVDRLDRWPSPTDRSGMAPPAYPRAARGDDRIVAVDDRAGPIGGGDAVFLDIAGSCTDRPGRAGGAEMADPGLAGDRLADRRVGRLMRAGWAGMAATAAGVALLASGGGVCLVDPYHAVDPAARALWLDRVSEALPLWRQGAEVFGASLALPLIGLAGAIVMWRRGPRRAWGVVLAMGMLSIGLALISTRAAVAAQALALPGAAALGFLGRARLAASGSMIVRVFGSVALFLCVSAIVPRLLVAAVAALPPGMAEAGDAACMAPPALAALDALPPATMLATIDATPALLLHTHHRGVAGPYHRNGRAIADTMRAWAGTPAAAEAIVRRHAIAFVIACGNPAEAQLYDRRAPDGFHARLMRGDVPGWLVRVRVPGTPWRVWRVRGAGSAIGSAGRLR